MRSRFLAAILACPLLCTLPVACTGDDDPSTSGEEPLLADCRGDATDAEVSDNVAIAEEYAQSLHEMVACGGLAALLCETIFTGITNAIGEGVGDATPDGWRFEEGAYRTDAAGAGMVLRLYAADDFSFASAGEPITENVFLADNYLTGVSAEIDFASGVLEVEFDGTGPLVELLGFGAEPESPLRLSAADLDEVNDRLGAIAFDADIAADDERPNGTIHYAVETERMTVLELATFAAPLRYTIVEADGSRAALQQELAVDAWTIQLVGENQLNGQSDFHVDGGRFGYGGTVKFRTSSDGELTLDCP